jgi:hypothetical protein
MHVLIALVLYCVAFGISFMVMIFGWGLEPQSWGWIIGGTATGLSVAAMAGWVMQGMKD